MLMRSHNTFFECTVGINMLSAECNSLISRLKEINPSLDRLEDVDVRKMDKSWTLQYFQAVACVFYAIAHKLRLNAKKVYTLVMSLGLIIFSIKNDLFLAQWNASGNDITVELNSILMSLLYRFVQMRMEKRIFHKDLLSKWRENFFQKPIPIVKAIFRRTVALFTYGDDSLAARNCRLPDDYFKLWAETGLHVTSADKDKPFNTSSRTLEEVQFLKRTFRFEDELGYYVPQLSNKSLARTLRIKKESLLSKPDHASVCLTEFMKESVFYGRKIYDERRKEILGVAERCGISDNPHLNIKPFDFWLNEIRVGIFTTWNAETGGVVLPTLGGGKEYQGTNLMNVNSVAKESVGLPIQTSTNEVSTNTVAILPMDANTVSNQLTTTRTPMEFLPTADIDHYLSRPVHIQSGSFDSSNFQGFIVMQFDPYLEFFSNPSVVDKIRNFKYFSGDIQVIMMITIPPGSCGMYAVTAMPRGGIAPGTSASLDLPYVLAPDNCVLIDCASTTSAVLQLDYFYPYEYLDIAKFLTEANDMWRIYVTCLSPIASGMGGTPTATVNVYANILPGYQLTIPTYQGSKKKHITANDALKKFSPKVHSMIGEGKASKMAGMIGDVASQLTKVPVLGPLAASVESAAAIAENVFSWFGFTRVSNFDTPTKTTIRGISNTANLDGDDNVEMSSLFQINQLNPDPKILNDPEEDDLAFPSLFQRWTLVRSLTWGSDSDSGSILGAIPVNPFYGLMDPLTHAIALPVAGYVGYPFKFWRGSMEYMINIPVSKFHRGVIQIIWQADGTVPTGDSTNVTYNILHDVSQGVCVQLHVGYAREVPYLKVVMDGEDLAIRPIIGFNGVLFIKVINPIVSQDVTTSVDVLVFARAGPDMDFQDLSEQIRWIDINGDPGLFPIRNRTVYQGALGDGAPISEMKVLVPDGTPYESSRCFGEHVRSVRAMFQKYSNAGFVEAKDAFNFGMIDPGRPQVNLLPAVFTFQNHYKQLFAGIAGSEKVKVIANVRGMNAFRLHDEIVAFPYYPPNISPIQFNTNYAVIAYDTANSLADNFTPAGFEFQIPWYTPRLFIGTHTNVINAVDFPKVGIIGDTPWYQTHSAFYYSLCDDVRVSHFYQPRRIAFNVSDHQSLGPFWS
jgi:hypothetical protein